MTLPEFGMQMDRLKICYGEKYFPEERIKILWKRYQTVSPKAFVQAADWIILNLPQVGTLVSILDERLRDFRTVNQVQEAQEISYECDGCRDFGYGWIGDEVRPCTCERGKAISEAEIARHQKNYDIGKALKEGRRFGSITKELPYDPASSVADSDAVNW